MAVTTTRRKTLLAPGHVLAPERYDPRRQLTASIESVPLGQIAKVVRDTIQPSELGGTCLVLDTSDAKEGIVVCRKEPSTSLGSTKKITKPGDVIISRLRPYLRQVAFVDDKIPNSTTAGQIVCSTEFFVLRSPSTDSIAFLVGLLLSSQVQKVLAASQEGGHHPRFDEQTLLTLPVPVSLVEQRNRHSRVVATAVRLFRESESSISKLIAMSQQSFSQM